MLSINPATDLFFFEFLKTWGHLEDYLPIIITNKGAIACLANTKRGHLLSNWWKIEITS